MFIVDAHLDLSMNAMEWNRDLRLPVSEIRKLEIGQSDKPDRSKNTVSFPELRKGNVGLVVATQIARYVKPQNSLPGWNSAHQAWAQTQGQLAWYKAMEKEGELRQISNLEDLESHLVSWNSSENNTKKPIGYILSLEGADSIIDIDYLEIAYNYGLRAIGPAHYGPGTYAQGTDAKGGIGEKGKKLLKEIERLGIILDATHLCDDSFWETMDNYNGKIWASHNLCRSLVDHNRQFSDVQLKELIARGAVIGGVFDAWMMVPNWQRGVSNPKSMKCNLEVLIDHLDHICQLAGNANHIGIGSDLDGGFGKEQCPYDLEDISDLQKIPDLLAKKGYSSEDITKIMHLNWLNFIRKAWA